MKKFFEASIVSRKTVKGTTNFAFQALSADGESLGKIKVKAYNEGSTSGLFFKYVPSQAADCNEPIMAVKFLFEEEELTALILEGMKQMITKSAAEQGQLLLGIMLSECIDSQAGIVKIPELATIAGIKITNEIIGKYAGDEWIGGEMKVLPELQDAVKRLADKKRSGSMMWE